jgi:hypothetical protein
VVRDFIRREDSRGATCDGGEERIREETRGEEEERRVTHRTNESPSGRRKVVGGCALLATIALQSCCALSMQRRAE